jgi:hypothetical protein
MLANGYDYPHRVRFGLITTAVCVARFTEQPVNGRTVATPDFGLLRPGTYELVPDDTPITCSFCKRQLEAD